MPDERGRKSVGITSDAVRLLFAFAFISLAISFDFSPRPLDFERFDEWIPIKLLSFVFVFFGTVVIFTSHKVRVAYHTTLAKDDAFVASAGFFVALFLSLLLAFHFKSIVLFFMSAIFFALCFIFVMGASRMVTLGRTVESMKRTGVLEVLYNISIILVLVLTAVFTYLNYAPQVSSNLVPIEFIPPEQIAYNQTLSMSLVNFGRGIGKYDVIINATNLTVKAVLGSGTDSCPDLERICFRIYAVGPSERATHYFNVELPTNTALNQTANLSLKIEDLTRGRPLLSQAYNYRWDSATRAYIRIPV
ncbi:MAG: hypothetical protein HY558_01555 [Euryarchaeota archaeon]|nr:hypothetical protein [Euryarchaeota archaeon]